MLDPKRIRSDKNYITKNLARRGVKVNMDEVIELDAKRRQLQSELDDLRAEKNRVSKEIGLAKSETEAISESKVRIRELNQDLKTAGVKNLYYLGGDALLGDDAEGTTDGSHPNDLGFLRQAEVFAPVLRKALGLE